MPHAAPRRKARFAVALPAATVAAAAAWLYPAAAQTMAAYEALP